MQRLAPYLKPSSGIGRGPGRRRTTSEKLKQARTELKQTKSELEETKARLEQLESDYADLFTRINNINDQFMDTGTKTKSDSKYSSPTATNMKAAFDELHKERAFVRIADLRRSLNWPRETFDNMLRKLRDNETLQIHIGDNTYMTPDDIRDSFIDEIGELMGTVTWM